MSKTTNIQKVECLKSFLVDLKKNKKYTYPKTSLEDMLDIKTQYIYKGSKDE